MNPHFILRGLRPRPGASRPPHRHAGRATLGAALAAACVLLSLFAGPRDATAAPAPKLESQGWPLPSREAEALFAPALRVPGDSAVLAAALRRAASRLQSGGWLDASVTARWDTVSRRLSLATEPGERYRWRSLSLAVPHEDSAALTAWLAFPAGQPADPRQLSTLVDGALRTAESRGHAWAQLTLTAFDAESAHVDVRLSGALGPAVKVSGVRIDGLQITRRDVAERALGKFTGQVYDPAAARAGAARLAQLGVFSRSEFVAIEGGPQWTAGTLAFRVEEPRYNRFEGAVGVQGQAGLVGLLSLELGNLLGTARSAELGWRSRGVGRTDFRMRYAEPYLAGLPFRLELALDQELQDSTYTRTRWGGRLAHVLGSGDRIDLGLEGERVVQTRGVVSRAELQNTQFGYERDGRDDLVSPRRGSRLRISGTGVTKREILRAPVPGEPASRRSNAGVADVRLDLNRPLRTGSGLSLDLWGAGRFSSDRVLSDYERYPVGGATTLRGHDEEAFRVDRVALSRFELRWVPGRAGERVSLFWDHAHMFTREPVTDVSGAVIGDRPVTRTADGLGFGLRLLSAGGFVDVDYGLEPGRSFLDGKLHLRLVSTF